MLVITKSSTSSIQKIILTLDESKTVNGSDYIITFTNVSTKQTVSITFIPADDISDSPSRYNEFNINGNAFADVPHGQYNYEVLEVDTDIIIENGKMNLLPETNNIIKGYEATTTIRGYAG